MREEKIKTMRELTAIACRHPGPYPRAWALQVRTSVAMGRAGVPDEWEPEDRAMFRDFLAEVRDPTELASALV